MNNPDWIPDNLDYGLEHGKGWNRIVKPLVDYCKKNDIGILQIKEKFGGLRFYYHDKDPELEALLQKAEDACDKTCEFCGTTENVTKHQRKGGYWIKTLCLACWENW